MNSIHKLKFFEYLEKYTYFDINLLNDISFNKFKNIWNFLIIKWNYCINILKDDILLKDSNYVIINKSSINNISDDEFYKLLIEFIENDNDTKNDNIMKIKFCGLCIDKYL